MIPLTPMLLVSTASAFVGIVDDQGDRGRVSALLARSLDVAASERRPSMAAAFVRHVGFWSHHDHECGLSSWPLPASGDLGVLAAFASECGILVSDAAVGDVWLESADDDAGGWVHAGIVTAVDTVAPVVGSPGWQRFQTVEWKSGGGAVGRVWCAVRRMRQVAAGSTDRFIRWVDLDGHGLPGRAGLSRLGGVRR